MRVLLVDDEPIARQIVREHLESFADIEIAGEAGNGVEAVELIQTLNPDVVFLDLQMPELGGLAVARKLRGDRMPLIIFVTAFEQHALEAFDAGAVDYLLKPVRQERLAAAIAKLRPLLGARPASIEKTAAGPARRIVGRHGANMHLLDPAEVVAFEADGETVFIITAAGGRYYAEHSLKALEARLDPRFRRVHRKTIINTDHIRRISPLSSKRWLLKMSNGMDVVVAKRLAGLIREETRW